MFVELLGITHSSVFVKTSVPCILPAKTKIAMGMGSFGSLGLQEDCKRQILCTKQNLVALGDDWTR